MWSSTRWDAVVDAAALQEAALALVRDGGRFIGVQPAGRLATERGITVEVAVARPDGQRLAGLLTRAAAGELPVRVQAAVPLADAADAYRAMSRGGVRGRYVLLP